MAEYKNITKAIINVMKEVKSIDKNLQVGAGNSSYKGVADIDVKFIIGQSMVKNGLAILPISIKPNVNIERWEETTQWNNQPQTKMKTQVFTEVLTKYLLLHESGESIEIEGYGHGIDSQDKSAGKATTYALKYALLYLFMVPTGKIDDADNKRSNDPDVPVDEKSKTQTKPWLNIKQGESFTKEYTDVCSKIQSKQYTSVNDIRKEYSISKDTEISLLKAFEKYQTL